MEVWKKLFVLFFLSLSLGQFGRIALPQKEIGLHLADILLTSSLLGYFLYLVKGRKKCPRLFLRRPISAFFLWGLVSLILSLRFFPAKEVLVGSLYLGRWLAYALVYFLALEISRVGERKYLLRALTLTGMIVTFWGFLQLKFWPDFSFMADQGWDPHYYRFLSVFFDPNFCGGFLVLVISLFVSCFLFDRRRQWLFLSPVVYSALVLTYSRSTYFAFLLSMLVIGALKEKKVFLVALVAFLLSFQVNSRVKTRVEGGVAVDESASHRLTSWDAAWAVVKNHPFVGVGFNNYRFAQLKYDLVDPVSRGGHAGAGADSSFLFIWATTGIVGLSISLWLGGEAIRLAFLKAKNDPWALALLASLTGLAFHSQFVNSLFFPPIMAYLWAILGAVETNG